MAEPGGVPDGGTLGQSRSTCLSKLSDHLSELQPDSGAWGLLPLVFSTSHDSREL